MAGRSGSILAADIGNVYTRVVLIDLVDGIYRLVARGEARSTTDFPIGDVTVGLARAMAQVSAVTGRKLVSEKDGHLIKPEQADRSGVDEFITTASTGRPLRTVLIGLVPDVSIASGVRAVSGTYIEIVETLSLEDHRSEEEQLNAILTSHPDLIFITGGIENGAREPVLKLAAVARLAVALVQRGHKPTVLYAGNSALTAQIEKLFDGLTAVFVAPNVRPSLDEEELEGAQLQLGLAFDERQANRGGGFSEIGEMSRLGVLPTAQSYQIIAEYLGQTSPGGVLAVDMGSSASVLSAWLDGKVHTVIRTDIGLGHSANTLLDMLGAPAVESWLPFITAPNQVRHYVLNKTLRPGTIPETLRGLYIEHALLRGGLQALLGAARPVWTASADDAVQGLMPPFNIIIGAGAGLTRTGNPGYNALLLLDSLQPTGVTSLLADPYGLIAALGALARVNPEAVVQVLDGSSLERLGTCFNLSGLPTAERPAMKVKITTEDGDVAEQEINGGHLWVYKLTAGKQALVEIRLLGRGLTIAGKGRVKTTVEGGTAGLIFDARGRPLPLAETARERAAQMPLWISEITGDALIPISEEWLVESSEEGDVVDDSIASAAAVKGKLRRKPTRTAKEKPAQAAKPRRGLFGRRGKAQPEDDDSLPVLEPLGGDDQPEEDDFQSALDELRGGR
jgi:hypothetical protein